MHCYNNEMRMLTLNYMQVLKDTVVKMFREALETEKKRIREENNTTDIQAEKNLWSHLEQKHRE